MDPTLMSQRPPQLPAVIASHAGVTNSTLRPIRVAISVATSMSPVFATRASSPPGMGVALGATLGAALGASLAAVEGATEGATLGAGDGLAPLEHAASASPNTVT